MGTALVALSALVSGCAANPEALPHAPSATDTAVAAAQAEDARVQALATDEKEALGAIAVTDSRFAQRMGSAADVEKLRASAMKALVAGDDDAAVQGGSLDLFSFAARARGLEEATKIASRSEAPTSDEARADGAIGRPRLERELLNRVVAEERARLEEERDLPRGASALARGIVDLWIEPDSANAKTSRDAWLVRRLDEVRASLSGPPLPRAVLLELDDALDPIERLAVPTDFPESAKALARIRVAIDSAVPATSDDVSWPRVASGLTAHLGVTLAPTEIRARLERTERTLRADAIARLARAGMDERAVARQAAELVFAAAPCGPVTRSPIRALAPSAERAPICGALRALHGATDDTTHAAIVVALHDEVVIALWSMGIHEGRLGPNRATALAHPFFGTPPEREAKWVRFAAARPVAAIGAGLAADLVTRAPEVSERWFAFGDAPLDVVERELFASSPSR